ASTAFRHSEAALRRRSMPMAFPPQGPATGTLTCRWPAAEQASAFRSGQLPCPSTGLPDPRRQAQRLHRAGCLPPAMPRPIAGPPATATKHRPVSSISTRPLSTGDTAIYAFLALAWGLSFLVQLQAVLA